jgi:hypothetical protein
MSYSGLEVVGGVSGTITLIDAAIRVVQKTTDFREGYQEADGSPKAFHEVLQRLPLVIDTLQQIKNDNRLQHNSAETNVAIQRVVKGCEGKAEELHVIFKDLAFCPGASRVEKYRQMISTLGKSKKVELLAGSMMQDLDVLVKTWFVGITTRQAVEKAMDDLAKVPSSTEQRSKYTVENKGSGPVVNNVGDYHTNHNNFGK